MYTVYTENKFFNELNNIRRIDFSTGVKIQNINNLILDITNNKKFANKFYS